MRWCGRPIFFAKAALIRRSFAGIVLAVDYKRGVVMALTETRLAESLRLNLGSFLAGKLATRFGSFGWRRLRLLTLWRSASLLRNRPIWPSMLSGWRSYLAFSITGIRF